MKKTILLIILVVSCFSVLAQSNPSSTTIYYASNGHTFKPGDELHLGIGSDAMKDFIFVYTNPVSLTGKINLGSVYAGATFHIKSIKTIENKTIGKKTYLVCAGGNIVNYYCDIEPALATGEVVIK